MLFAAFLIYKFSKLYISITKLTATSTKYHVVFESRKNDSHNTTDIALKQLLTCLSLSNFVIPLFSYLFTLHRRVQK